MKEHLNVRGMMKNRQISKLVAKMFHLWLTNPCQKYDIELRQVCRFLPSSKTCSFIQRH